MHLMITLSCQDMFRITHFHQFLYSHFLFYFSPFLCGHCPSWNTSFRANRNTNFAGYKILDYPLFALSGGRRPAFGNMKVSLASSARAVLPSTGFSTGRVPSGSLRSLGQAAAVGTCCPCFSGALS